MLMFLMLVFCSKIINLCAPYHKLLLFAHPMAQIIMLCSLYTKDKIGVYPLKEMLIFVIHLHRQLSFFFHPKALVIILCLPYMAFLCTNPMLIILWWLFCVHPISLMIILCSPYSEDNYLQLLYLSGFAISVVCSPTRLPTFILHISHIKNSKGKHFKIYYGLFCQIKEPRIRIEFYLILKSLLIPNIGHEKSSGQLKLLLWEVYPGNGKPILTFLKMKAMNVEDYKKVPRPRA